MVKILCYAKSVAGFATMQFLILLNFTGSLYRHIQHMFVFNNCLLFVFSHVVHNSQFLQCHKGSKGHRSK